MMKITKQLLKEMIGKQMEQSLMEIRQPKYDRILSILKDAPYKSIAIMSGQYPMGAAPDPRLLDVEKRSNAIRKENLEDRLSELGFKFERIGGKFGPNIEQAVLIYNPNQEPTVDAHWEFLHVIAGLNREFEQWGFVGGEKISSPENQDMAFTLFEIDYNHDDPRAYRAIGTVPMSSTVLDDTQMTSQQDDYSFDPTSGKKFGIKFEE
jgi:hypothetical protein